MVNNEDRLFDRVRRAICLAQPGRGGQRGPCASICSSCRRASHAAIKEVRDHEAEIEQRTMLVRRERAQ